MKDVMTAALLGGGAGLVGVLLVSVLLTFFIALKAGPARRAAWTTGTAYLVVAACFVFGLPAEDQLYGPLVPLPGALIVFCYWYWAFRRRWIDDVEIAEGMKLENDDWRLGIIVVGGIVTFLVVRTLLRIAL
jgi:hypothetical protein